MTAQQQGRSPDESPERELRRRFEELFTRHQRSVLGYVLRRTDDPHDAADIVSDTFLVAWRRIDTVPVGDEARAWLLAVARKTTANHRRGAHRRNALSDRLGGALQHAATGIRLTVDPDPSLRMALARLSAEDREVLMLTGWEELSPNEIATVLGLRGSTVRSRLRRARSRLRAHLDDLDRADARLEERHRGRPATEPILAEETNR